MRRVIRQVNKKRTRMLAFNKFDSTVCQVIWQVSASLDKLPIVLKHWTKVIPPVPGTETIELVKPSCIGMIRMLHPTMPLTKRGSAVTCFPENLTDHYFICIDAFTTLGSRVHTTTNVMPSSEKLCASWRTDWANVEVLKPCSVTR